MNANEILLNNVNNLTALQGMARLYAAIEQNCADLSKIKMETSMREIKIIIDHKTIVKAEKDFFNEVWTIRGDGRLKAYVAEQRTSAPMF